MYSSPSKKNKDNDLFNYIYIKYINIYFFFSTLGCPIPDWSLKWESLRKGDLRNRILVWSRLDPQIVPRSIEIAPDSTTLYWIVYIRLVAMILADICLASSGLPSWTKLASALPSSLSVPVHFHSKDQRINPRSKIACRFLHIAIIRQPARSSLMICSWPSFLIGP